MNMIAVVKQGASEQQIENLVSWFHSRGLKTHISKGEIQTIIGLIGDTSKVDIDLLEGLDIVESVKRITEPFKSANRKFHPQDTVVDVNGIKIGGGHFQLIAGPCSVESPEQILCIAESVKASGAALLRGGAFKPRTSPYDFQGLRAEGIDLLLEAKAKTGMPIVTEIMSAAHLHMFDEVYIIQVGARNMQNFEMLKELGQLKKPILLKRGFCNTLQELLMSAEYIMAGAIPT
jgi:3-deoxy-7-phosphoheptulonate synthase